MDAEVAAALIGAGASLALAVFTAVQTHSSARRTDKEQRQQRAETAEEQRKLRAETEAWQREQIARSAEQARQLAEFQAELERQALRDQERSRREEVISRFREPLAGAAYDLQSRLWNILDCHFLEAYLVSGNDREKAYAIENTAYVIAQYFAWTEIVRREIQIIDLQEEAETAKLAHQQDRISSLWGSDHEAYGMVFRIWAGEQRAIGELLIEDVHSGSRCMGYSRFVELLHGRHSPFLDILTSEISALPQHPRPHRLEALQHALIDQLEILDPKFIRFPRQARSKVMIASLQTHADSPAPPLYGRKRPH
jgi:hypothetical protein